MRMKKRTIVFAMAAMLTVLLLNGCGKDKDAPNPEDPGKEQTTEQGADPSGSDLDRAETEKIAQLEAEITELGSVKTAKITKERSEYHVKITLDKGKRDLDDELRDVIITKLTASYEDLKEDAVKVEVEEPKDK